MQFSEEDWTHLKALCRAAPERYSARVLEEATAVINDESLKASDRLIKLTTLLRVHDNRAMVAFGGDKRSPMDSLTALLSVDLLTEADLDGFSPGVRATAVTMGDIVRMPREIVIRDPDADEEVPPPRMLVVSGRELEVRVVTGLRDEASEARGLPPCHVGIEVEYRGEAKIVDVVSFDGIPSWGTIAREVEVWIERDDPWSWEGEAAH